MGMKKVFNPAIFQGEWKTKNYYEEWFFKLSDASEENTFIFIPGVSLGKKADDFHTYVQIIDVNAQQQYFLKYTIKDSIYSSESFNIKIGENIFSEHGLTLKNDVVKGRINFRTISKWPASPIGRHTMGLFDFFPFLPTRYAIYSMNLSLAGSITINGRTIDFSNGKGYIEKSWGKRFPTTLVWSQCSHFDRPNTSFSLSLSKTPFFFSGFKMFSCCFFFEGRHYSFNSRNGAKIIKFEPKGNFIEASFSKNHILFEITIEKNDAGLIPAAEEKQTGRLTHIGMKSKVYVKLYKNSKLLFSGQGTNCAVEIEGDVTKL